MRSLVSLVLLAACGPTVAPKGTVFDEELPRVEASDASAEPAAPTATPRPEAPPGKGLRTGTIERAQLIAVLDGGAGNFLRQVELTPRMDGKRFVGWQLVQLLDRSGPLHDVDVAPGDVLLSVNGATLSRPDHLQTVWDALRTANELRAQLWRGDGKLELAFAIEPRVELSGQPSGGPPARPATPATPAR